jgi:hypothetical protein
MTIDTLEPIGLGGTTQWIRTRGQEESNPVLLMIQQGPGLPTLNEARHFDARSDSRSSRWSTGTNGAAAAR